MTPCPALLLASLLAASSAPAPAVPSDHGDTPLLNTIARPDAKLTDLHAFVRGGRLVLLVCTNPAIPNSATSYVWPSDVQFVVHVDNTSQVTFADATDLQTYGGTIVRPDRVRSRASFRVGADANGVPHLSTTGLNSGMSAQDLLFFAGLRDDPFIRGPRIGKNVAAFVIELPLAAVTRGNRPILLWATASIEGRSEPFQDLAGRSLRSMFVANDFMNTEEPADHARLHGVVPDVMIFDPAQPAAFPNGRELADDVVDLVGDPGTLANDSPFPSANDVPFLTAFPYLAPPQP